MDFDYKKYSLENLENWMHDAMSSGGASPQEIYDVIVGVVKENYYMYKQQTSQAYELLALLNSGVDNSKYQNYLSKVLSCDKDDPSEKCKKSWTSFWADHPHEHSQYTDEELDAMCDKAEFDEKKCKSVTGLSYVEATKKGWEMTADGFWIPPQKEDKVVKWQLPVEMHPSGEYFVIFPDDLLKVANFEEGDEIKWIDNGDGSYTIRKVTKEIEMEDC